MLAHFRRLLVVATLAFASSVAIATALSAQTPDAARLERLKAEALTRVEARAKQIQEIAGETHYTNNIVSTLGLAVWIPTGL